ncbi:MAG: NAD(P)-dependent glycerol-3-phosphate dehydrogenase [Desulfovibrionaceae bacterium]|jgi:glycerol-3-phosphate dehydrogenase (NAD(P)+)|nr:NAD(P)-dependent glycerol-3-phosphate dehydrogenase [Desulfovibrionaceae bacterium]
MKITVIGAGAWGTTLADLLARKGVETTLWVREQEVLSQIKATRRNAWYLPDLELSEALETTMDAEAAVRSADALLFVVPSQFFRTVLTEFFPFLPKRPVVVCANKGIEVGALRTMSQIVEEELSTLKPRFAMLSGPSFAHEVARRMPTAVALGCEDKKLGRQLQEAFSTDYFRVYTNPDVRGVELGGAVKNVIAIAAGIADGLEFGSDARAALITRGLAEMSRLGRAMGADPHTFMGLAGMGDLVLTCTGDLSRNRQVGLRLGRGQQLMDILNEMKAVAEGVKTTEALYALGSKYGVEMPITEQVYQVLYKSKDPRLAVTDLMGRALKDE